MKPTITLIPLREVVTSDAYTQLDLIVRIESPQPQEILKRSKLNLGLVIDRSGSMQGQKMDYARKAAIYAVEQLKESDRVSITIYDNQVEVIVPNTLATNKTQIIEKIKHIHSRGSTNLYEGWLEGGKQVSQKYNNEQLNRVILLSDGLANDGETNPDVICTHVHGLMQHGVSTSTMGIGDDFNEDLMEAMAKSGDGNYYYIESPDSLPTIFQAELQGIIATIGSKVSLGIEPSRNIEVLDVFNDLSKTRYGRYKLPNLIMGNQI
ncbi:vWA domain-containing protein [Aphanothece hegewaldii]|uniref:vWA domain-containing protein n=1 Tax=Aphanothece hegewaldii TaxID=1521625 RepID=UPI001FE751AD|nr:VWA domain-containing protein [Aphanothece hegewaldii]